MAEAPRPPPTRKPAPPAPKPARPTRSDAALRGHPLPPLPRAVPLPSGGGVPSDDERS
jgi:hypothetical protein